jgi:hypothetical protein
MQKKTFTSVFDALFILQNRKAEAELLNEKLVLIKNSIDSSGKLFS